MLSDHISNFKKPGQNSLSKTACGFTTLSLEFANFLKKICLFFSRVLGFTGSRVQGFIVREHVELTTRSDRKQHTLEPLNPRTLNPHTLYHNKELPA